MTENKLQPWQKISLGINIFCLAVWGLYTLLFLFWNVPRVFNGSGLNPFSVAPFWFLLIGFIPLFLISLSLYPFKRLILTNLGIVLFLGTVILIFGIEEMY